MTQNKDINDIIAIIIALNFIYDNFDTKTSTLLEAGDKTIDEIQQISYSTEAKNPSKPAIGMTSKLIMAFQRPGR